jgi:hypothetical protein
MHFFGLLCLIIQEPSLEIRGISANPNTGKEDWDDDFDDFVGPTVPIKASQSKQNLVLSIPKKVVTQEEEITDQVRFIKQALTKFDLLKGNLAVQPTDALGLHFSSFHFPFWISNKIYSSRV